MVKKTNKKLARRKVLQMSGAGMAAFSGTGAIGTAVANSPEKTFGHPESYTEHRADKAEQNQPKFTDNGNVGFSKGGFDNPVTEGTVDKLYSVVLGNNLERSSAALPRPTRDQDGPGNADEVFGMMVTVEDGTPYISVERKPVGLGSLTEQRKELIEGRVHGKIDNKVRKYGRSQADATNGGN